MTIATKTETYGGGDYRWLADSRALEHPKSGTVDISTFTAGTHYPDGYLPSGTPVTFDSGSGMYEPATASDTADGLAGFVAHDLTVHGGNDLPFAVVTDATIVAEHLPGTYDLTDGRYICDQESTEASS